MSYKRIYDPKHEMAFANGYVQEHVFIAMKALGKPLPAEAVVHHHTKDQLVICQNRAYHNLIHRRQRAYKACGHANYMKCSYCKRYDDPANMHTIGEMVSAYHKKCKRKHDGNKMAINNGCLICGKSFKVKGGHPERYKTCSPGCRSILSKEAATKQWEKNKKKIGTITN